jgi:hypothetical protein
VNTRSKLAAFGLVLAGALGAGALAGTVVGPIAASEDENHVDDEHDPAAGHSATAPQSASMTEETDMPAGVLIAQDGYALDPETTILDGRTATLRFRILGPDGTPVHDFVARHERKLHLIVVSTDLGSYRHLHPTLTEDGTWSAELPALAPGTYRAFADFAVADGPELTLGVDLSVAGDTSVAPLPEPAATTTIDGHDVTLAGAPAADAAAELRLSVRRDGRPVTDLEPYLGAFGHLVAIRSGDLAYLHVHPLGDEPAADDRGGPEVAFSVHVPSPGDYRLFFDFSHDGTVHTAAFTVHVPAGDAGARGYG